jgi:hypothetical protein
MKQILLFLSLLLLTATGVLGQRTGDPFFVSHPKAAGGGAIPVIANFRGSPSTETNAVTTLISGTTTCNAYSYCTQLPDPTLSGNGIVVFYTYLHAGGAEVPTVYDCTTYGCHTTVDTFTSCGTEGENVTNTVYVGCFYTLTATTGSRNITVVWPSVSGITNVSVHPASFYNVTAKDGYNTASGSTTGTFTSGSITPGFTNDLFFEFAVETAATMPLNIGAWTLGSACSAGTWKPDLADRRDAIAIQHAVVPNTSACTPSITNATATNNYVALGVAFKAGSAGTAPTGMYINHLYTVNSAPGGSGNLVYQVPLSGNLIVAQHIGGAMYATAMSDTTNGTWTSCGPGNLIGDGSLQATSSTFYVPNATSGLLNTTITTSGTGDIGPSIFFDIVGADTTQLCNHASPQGYVTATGATTTSIPSYAPSSSAGISLFSAGVSFNTGIGCTAPSGCSWDLNTFGGESLSGPEPVDENNMGGGHLNFTSNTSGAVTWSLSSSTTAIDSYAAEAASFRAPGATLYPSEVKQIAATAASGTTLSTASYTPFPNGDTASPHLLAVMACVASSVAPTITVSDAVNGSYTKVDPSSGVATLRNGVYCATFYKAAISTSTLSAGITATFTSASGVSFTDIMVEEFANASTLDQHNIAAITSNASTGALVGTSVTTTSANEVLFGGATCSNCNITQVGGASFLGTAVTTQSWTQENNDGAGNVSGYWVVSATGTYAVDFIDTTKGSGDCVAIMTFH